VSSHQNVGRSLGAGQHLSSRVADVKGQPFRRRSSRPPCVTKSSARFLKGLVGLGPPATAASFHDPLPLLEKARLHSCWSASSRP